MREMKRSGKMRRSKRKVCAFCVDKAESIDYKDINKLRKFVQKEVRFFQEESLVLALSIKDN